MPSSLTTVSQPCAPFLPLERKPIFKLLVQKLEGDGLLHLRLDEALLPLLESLVQRGRCQHLHTLDLSYLQLMEEDEVFLGQVLAKGGLKSLQELNLEGGALSLPLDISGSSLPHVFDSLSKGACPNLRRLRGCSRVIDNLTALLLSHACPLHEQFNLSMISQTKDRFRQLMQSIESGHCPRLRALTLKQCELSVHDAEALATVLRLAYGRRLEVLGLGCIRTWGDEGVAAIMRVLEHGSCPHLKTLDLSHSILSSMAVTAFARALLSGNCRGIEALHLTNAFRTRHGNLQVLRAMRDGACRQVRHLFLQRARMDDTHARLCERRLGRLRNLEIYNRALTGGGLRCLALAVDEGARAALEAIVCRVVVEER